MDAEDRRLIAQAGIVAAALAAVVLGGAAVLAIAVRLFEVIA